jgi:hypothetical protein
MAFTIMPPCEELYTEPLGVLSAALLMIDIDSGELSSASNSWVKLQDTKGLLAFDITRVDNLLAPVRSSGVKRLLTLRITATTCRAGGGPWGRP